LLAGEFAGGAVVVCPLSGLAPPVCGAAAPPCAVPGFDWTVVVWVGVVAGAVVVVDVSVVVVAVVVVELSTVGVFASPGTVSVGAVFGSDSAALLPLPPHAEMPTTAAVSSAAAVRRGRFTGSALDSREPAAARRAVRHILGCQLLERATAQPQVLDRPGQAALARGERQDLPDHGELVTGLTVDVHDPRLDLANDLAVVPGAQAV
jgi:hypothetical protein